MLILTSNRSMWEKHVVRFSLSFDMSRSPWRSKGRGKQDPWLVRPRNFTKATQSIARLR